MSRKARYILLFILIVASVAGIVAFRMLNKAPETVDDAKAVQVSAADFASQFVADEAKANQQYLNKAVQVTGAVAGVEKNQDGGTMVLLETGDPMMAVQCAMRDQNVTVETGKTVTIKGFYSAASMLGISLTGCVIVK